MKYVHYDNAGKIIGWYDPLIHAEIPQSAVQVGDALWRQAVSINANHYNATDNTVSVVDYRTPDEIQSGLLMSLGALCDAKTTEAKNYINGAPVSNEQLRRYEEKYEMAKAYKATGAYAETLQLEADLAGTTVDQLADLIIASGDAYKQALINFNAMIEAFRVKVKAMISAGDLAGAQAVMEKAKMLGANATPDDIRGLFA
ncbi:MAG: hypothetical protein L3J47_12420 [Sulfurovum sp.]|nr:hypothetical protein [Sulfurovum sp.]